MEVFREGEDVEAFNAASNTFKKAQIIRIRNDKKEAFVHFHLLDKRQDDWLNFKQIKKIIPQIPKPGFEPPDYKISPGSVDLSDEDKNDFFEASFEHRHQDITKLRSVQTITLGPNTFKTWYLSPFPGHYSECEHLFICDYCGDYFDSKEQLIAHKRRLKENRPPGREIYRKGNISIFELQGRLQKYCCQCLCLLGKLFIHHKTLYYDVEGFYFYVLCECDENGAHIASYISKELYSDAGNVLACILVLPPYQKKGYGRTMISLSYELAKRQKKCGTPEHPLSDLGKIAFRSFWKDAIIRTLYKYKDDIHSISDIIVRTGIMENDVISTLSALGFITTDSKGNKLVSPVWDDIVNYISLNTKKGEQLIDKKMLIWDPDNDDFDNLGLDDISDEDEEEEMIDRADALQSSSSAE